MEKLKKENSKLRRKIKKLEETLSIVYTASQKTMDSQEKPYKVTPKISTKAIVRSSSTCRVASMRNRRNRNFAGTSRAPSRPRSCPTCIMLLSKGYTTNYCYKHGH